MDQSSPAPAFDGDGRLGFDPSVAARRLRKADPALGRVMDDFGPFGLEAELQRAPTLLHSLAEAITYQQLTAKAAATIFERVRVYLPDADEVVAAERVLGTSDEQLRAAGLSRAKALAVRDLAQRVVDGELPTLAELASMSDDEVIERLIEVRGIGRWTAQMLLIFRLGRPDVLPTGDYGLRKGFGVAFGAGPDVPSSAEVAERGLRWQPDRTMASWYLWRVAEST
jgi:3-methyladenine DNA glycosylase/8-oxoguanine DNA glycosylase